VSELKQGGPLEALFEPVAEIGGQLQAVADRNPELASKAAVKLSRFFSPASSPSFLLEGPPTAERREIRTRGRSCRISPAQAWETAWVTGKCSSSSRRRAPEALKKHPRKTPPPRVLATKGDRPVEKRKVGSVEARVSPFRIW